MLKIIFFMEGDVFDECKYKGDSNLKLNICGNETLG